MADSILFLGEGDAKLPQLLEKLGYSVIRPEKQIPLGDLVARSALDIVLLDGRIGDDWSDLVGFLRSQEQTKSLPIVLLVPEGANANSSEISSDKLSVLNAPISTGVVAGRLATELRIRKLNGRDELKATLSEVNASLRDHNDRLKRELEEARAIQQGLLPDKLPSDPRFQLAVSYVPLEEVGGDWYSSVFTPEGKVALQIADVTGHGLGAAFVGSMTKLAMAAVNTHNPGELLTGLNRLMAPQIPPGRFVTMGSLLYDPASGDLEWARAGHPPAMLVRKANLDVSQLKGDGFAVGFFDDSEYSNIRDHLEPGDMLFMYTDGISEAQNRSLKTYGLDRLTDVLKRCVDLPSVADIIGAVLDDVDLFREERRINDDVTVLVLRRLA